MACPYLEQGFISADKCSIVKINGYDKALQEGLLQDFCQTNNYIHCPRFDEYERKKVV